MKNTADIILTIIAILLSLCVILLLWVSCNVLDLTHEGKFRLSAMNNWLCKAFLLSHKVTIPEEYSSTDFQLIFANLEDAPKAPATILTHDYPEDFLEEIRDVVNAYYGIEP